MLKDLIDIDFSDGTASREKEIELKRKLKKNESKIRNKLLELNCEREALQDRLEDIESAIINIESLMEWSKI